MSQLCMANKIRGKRLVIPIITKAATLDLYKVAVDVTRGFLFGRTGLFKIGNSQDNMPSAEVKTLVDTKIAGKRVMVFSKSSCPYCKKAKSYLKQHIPGELSEEDYEVMEIENDKNCGAIQDYLKQLTGGRSVPRVFINGKFMGGGDETEQFHKSGKLSQLLKA